MSIRVLSILCFAVSLQAQVTFEQLRDAPQANGNWPTYSGGYNGWRHSPLDQISRANAGKLKVKWVYQMGTQHTVETTPLVVNGVMYVTEPPSNVVALDAETGKPFWRYARVLPPRINVCCGQVNRGVAVLGDRVYVGTVDAHLVPLDRRPGAGVWDVVVADERTGRSITR